MASYPSNPPGIVKYAYCKFEVFSDKKWRAKCNFCSETITETRGTSSGFSKHLERRHTTEYSKYKSAKGKEVLLFFINMMNLMV